MLLRPKPGDCDVREVVDERFELCGRPGIIKDVLVDPGCPDNPDDGPHEFPMLYCIRHRDHASTPSTQGSST